jgi:hypothetical protein
LYLKNGVFLDVIFLRSVCRLLVTASVVPSSPILVTLIKEALSPSVTSVLTRATRRNISENTILHNHRRENLKSYILIFILGIPFSGMLRRVALERSDVSEEGSCR